MSCFAVRFVTFSAKKENWHLDGGCYLAVTDIYTLLSAGKAKAGLVYCISG